MSVNVQDIIKSLEERKNRNLKYLEKKAPQILELLKKPSKLSNTGIYIDSTTGRLDLQVEGKRLYGSDPLKISISQVDDFERTGFKFYIKPDTNTQYRDMMMDMRHWHEYLTKAKEEPNVDFVKKPIRKGDRFGTFLCLGIGLGYHLVEITKRYEIKQLIVVERDPEILKASLFTVDWQFLDKYMKDNRTFNVFIKENPTEGAEEVVRYCQFVLNPPLSFDMPVYLCFNESYYTEFFSEFHRRFSQIFTGWGFFQDEYWSVEHTLENILNEIPLFYRDTSVSPDAVAFIIGAGPSLDKSIEFIGENMEKAVIFSCGSSLATLHKADLKPDFHIEIERTVETYDALRWINDENYFKSFPIIFNNPMYPKVSTLFEEKYMYLKQNDAGTLFFNPSIAKLSFSNPTVVNGGLSFAINAGFKKIYLFGTDMGYKDPKKHHASNNVSFDEKSYFFKEEMEKDIEIEGNFGGKVYTNLILTWARTWLEDFLKTVPEIEVFNTSDGAKIKGTIPVQIEQIKLKKFNKEQEIRLIKDNFKKDYLNEREYLISRLTQLEKETLLYKKYSLNLLNKHLKTTSQLMDALHNIFVWIYLNQVNGGMLNYLVRGGFLHYEHLTLFLCYQKEIRGINFVSETVEAIRRYIEESTSMLLNLIDKYKRLFKNLLPIEIQ
ncbi:6-hydroxymethylpterin diphosphokinase MptE-like protein [Thermodesulfovibrio sp.]|uniref:motility associated factor glycosyltransferase family protein n=1 Tax=Thermodesulfovibrio sp. TaxID=2067987 RepID=UPI0030A6042F